MAATNGAEHGSEYREFLPDITTERFTNMRKQNAHEYAKAFENARQPPWFHAIYMHWQELVKEPYRGVTTDYKSIAQRPVILTLLSSVDLRNRPARASSTS